VFLENHRQAKYWQTASRHSIRKAKKIQLRRQPAVGSGDGGQKLTTEEWARLLLFVETWKA